MRESLKIFFSISFLLILALIILQSGILDKKPCLDLKSGLTICAASDMAKITKTGRIPFEDESLDISNGGITLNAARNETVAFQLLLKASSNTSVTISLEDLKTTDQSVIDAKKNSQIFKSYYHHVEKGGYTWGTKSKVLPWPDDYPDALIPQLFQCQNKRLFESIAISADQNQAVWLDLFIPKKQSAGTYQGQIKIQHGNSEEMIPLTVQVWQVTLPDQPTIEAVGELYDSYKQEGAGVDLSDPKWQKMAHCYQQMAHRHRMVFIERTSVKPDQSWQQYNQVYAPIFDGRLFSEEFGYNGPGLNTPVAIWRTPWPQLFNARLKNPLTDQQIGHYQILAKKWHENVVKNNWQDIDFFAYVFDEVDGATDEDQLGDVSDDYVAMVHTQMDKVQKAIDAGTADQSIDLIWTSHTNPRIWQDNPQEDLKDIIRLWTPSADSADVAYLADRKAEGDTIWFYHSGHPAVGIHSINASGIEMRTWGVISARYNFDGHFMWAINLSDPERPYEYPSYKKADDRFGNGTLVYPGNKLDQIDESIVESNPGPIPSMRLKSWRRGLQDAELIALAKQAGHKEEVEQLLNEMIPRALSEGQGSASWSNNPQDWIQFQQRLLELAADKTNL